MKKALIVVDYQNDFVDGALGFAGAEKLEPGIAALVQRFLADGDQVVFTLDTHDATYPNTREGRALPVSHCQRDGHGWRLFGALAAYMDDPRVTLLPKVSFAATAYDCLQKDPPTEITLVGVVTNMCVISNAVMLQTLFPQANIIIESSLCGSFDSPLHQKSLEVMAGLQMVVR